MSETCIGHVWDWVMHVNQMKGRVRVDQEPMPTILLTIFVLFNNTPSCRY